MNSKWFKGLKASEKEQRKRAVLANLEGLEILSDVLSGEVKTLPKPDYNSSGWAYEAADVNGYNRAIQDVIKLLDIKD